MFIHGKRVYLATFGLLLLGGWFVVVLVLVLLVALVVLVALVALVLFLLVILRQDTLDSRRVLEAVASAAGQGDVVSVEQSLDFHSLVGPLNLSKRHLHEHVFS